MQKDSAQEKICELGKRLAQERLVAGHDGNISIRLESGTIAISPTMKNKSEMKPEDIVFLELDGKQVGGKLKASSEASLHLEIYKARPAINCVIHAHPVYATAFAAAGKEISSDFLDEAIMFPGKTPLIPFSPAGSLELAQKAASLSKGYNSCLLEKHGAVSFSDDPDTAFYLMQKIEQQAQIYYLFLNITHKA